MRALITTDTVGGVWTFTQELTTQLIARGWAICLVSIGGTPSRSQRDWCSAMKARSGRSFHHDWLEAPLEWMPENEGAWRDAGPRLAAMAREFGASIVHANQFCFGALPVEMPVVVTAHSDVLSWARACGRTLEDSNWLRTYRRLVQRGIESAAAVVAPTRWMADSAQRDFHPPTRVDVIPNGRSLPAGTSVNRRLQAVTAGRLWDEAKNIELLAGVDSPLPLLIAGAPTAPEGSSTKIPANVKLLGSLAAEDLHALFRESAIYICPSRYEPFGLAALEAGQCGCGVLASDLPSLREVWHDGALYFRESAELETLLRRLAADPRQLAAAQLRALRRARQFSSKRMAEGYEALFLELIAAGNEGTKRWHAVCA